MSDANERRVRVGELTLGGARPFLIAGPCVLESRQMTHDVAGRLDEICRALEVPLVFKSSFDKANRTSLSGARGPGSDEGLGWLAEVRAQLGIPVLTDVHLPEQCARAAEAVDVLQIPAFLCRQTDLLVAAARTGKAVNVKKGQFLAPWDIGNAARKVVESGNPNVLLTERGTSFGYGRLVVDMTGFRHMAATGHPVVFDATHSVQLPGALGERTGGDRTLAPVLARAAMATGDVDGLFFEVHPDPDAAPSDGPNMVRLDAFASILEGVLAVHAAVRGR
jgi:2-dehydro-3-deoxyphosphooctonate aldolase (KDO 8-P synthase)